MLAQRDAAGRTNKPAFGRTQCANPAAAYRVRASATGRQREEHVMPQRAWNDKRERQYEHIKEGLLERGETEDTAEEIAARTVNKERARHGEARESSRSSTEDI